MEEVQEDLDRVAEGGVQWKEMLGGFYDKLSQQIEAAVEQAAPGELEQAFGTVMDAAEALADPGGEENGLHQRRAPRAKTWRKPK